MDAELRKRLTGGATDLGFPLSPGQADKLLGLLDLLLDWNQRVNLTGLRTLEQGVDRHLLDSLTVARVARPGRLADVGTGAGFPGLPVAVVRPDIQVTLVESIHKKAAFVRAAARSLGVEVDIVTDRLEHWRPSVLGQFSTAVARAMLPPPQWVPAGAPLVSPGGLLIAMVTAGEPPPPAPSNFTRLPDHPYTLPDSSNRALLLYERAT